MARADSDSLSLSLSTLMFCLHLLMTHFPLLILMRLAALLYLKLHAD